jgi:hypothetical protein
MYSLSNNRFKDKYDSQQNNDKNDTLKQQYINHIFNSIDLSKFKYLSLELEEEFPRLLEKKYFISANFSGSNCLLVFTKIKDKYHQFLIDRKTLSYNSSKVNLSQLKITPVNIKLDINIYKERGTIFDGIFITDKNTKTFVITDVYMFKGQDESLTRIDNKLSSVMAYLSSNYNSNDKENTMTLTVNKLFKITQVEELIKKTIPKIKDFVIKGICFYPEKSGTKLIFMFDNDKRNIIDKGTRISENKQIEYSRPNENKQYENRQYENRQHENRQYENRQYENRQYENRQYENRQYDNRQNEYKKFCDNKSQYNNDKYARNDSSSENTDEQNNDKNKKTQLLSPQKPLPIDLSKLQIDGKIVLPTVKKLERDVYIPNGIIKDTDYVFEMQKTDTVDVYNLNVVEIVANEGKKLYKRIKIGLALIPGMERSIWCQELFDMQACNILVNCKFHKDKQKWEPIQVAESAKRPNVVTDFIINKI